MVTTRGRRSAAAVEVKNATPTRSRRLKDDTPQEPDASSDALEDTIGSRLRKRRFATTDTSSPLADKSSERKRRRRSLTPAMAKKSSSPAQSTPIASRKRQARVSDNNKSTKSPETTTKRRRTSTSVTPSTASHQASQASIEEKDEAIPEVPVPPRHPDLQSLSLEDQFKHVLAQNPAIRLGEEQETAIISKIRKYCEQVDQYARWGKNVDTEGMETMGADPDLKKDALPILANLTMQALHVFASYGVQELTVIMTETASKPAHIFEVHRRLFDNTKKIYATKDAFISISDLTSDTHLDAAKIARNANLATFVTSCFGTQEVGFYHLNDYFLETFVNDGSRLLKQQAGLYLELKTQAYLSAMSNFERSKGRVLDELFPHDLEQQLLSRRVGARSLHPSESEFVERARNRRGHLEREPEIPAALDKLKDRYKWDAFLAELANYLNKNFEAIVEKPISTITPMCGEDIVSTRPLEPLQAVQPHRPSSSHYAEQHSPLSVVAGPSQSGPPYQGMQPISHPPPPPPAYYYPPPPPLHMQPPPMHPNGPQPPLPMHPNEDIVAKAQRAAQEAFQSYLPNGHTIVNGVPRPPPNPYHGPYPPHPPPPNPYHPSPPHQSPYGPPPSHMGQPPMVQQAPLPHGHHPYPPPNQHPYYGPPPGPMTPHQQPPYLHHSPGPAPPLHYGPRPEEHHFMPHQFSPPHPGQPGPYYHPHPGAPPPFQGMQMAPPGFMPVPHGQSLPTAVLYEKARAVANSKSSSGGRNKASNVSQRRPWTTDEEQALMAGLDQVKGPHWSQILALYGPGGTISEALRDRTQVQLKDKARNLKLFFLKSKIEVPYYLGFVTGELKSRAPSHVAYDEANASENATLEKNGKQVSNPEGEASSEVPSTPTPAPDARPVQSVENTTPAASVQPSGPNAAESGTYTSPYTAIPSATAAPMGQSPNSPLNPVDNDNLNIDPSLGLSNGPIERTHEDTDSSIILAGVSLLASNAAKEAAKAIASLDSNTRMNGNSIEETGVVISGVHEAQEAQGNSAENESAAASAQLKSDLGTADGNGTEGVNDASAEDDAMAL